MTRLQNDEIRENLSEAGCTEAEIGKIIGCIACDDLKGAESMIFTCRQKHLDVVHENQKCIDRLDYLSYHLNR